MRIMFEVDGVEKIDGSDIKAIEDFANWYFRPEVESLYVIVNGTNSVHLELMDDGKPEDKPQPAQGKESQFRVVEIDGIMLREGQSTI